MRTRTLIIVTAIIFSFGLGACAKKPSADDKILAKVSSKPITVGDFKTKIAHLPPYYQNIVNKNKKRFLEELIMEKLLYEDGVRKGLDRDKEIKELVNEAKKKIIIAKVIKNEVDDKVKVPEDEIKNFYEAHRQEFKTPAMWRASHILVADEAGAKLVQEELAKGANFEELARTRSIDATASRGGDVGYFRSGQVVPEFERAAASLSVGQTSDIVRTQFGYHIIKLTDKKEEGVQNYEEARRVIETELKRKKSGELFNKMVANLKDKYTVDIDEKVFENNIEGANK